VAGRRADVAGDGAGRAGVPVFVVAFLALVLLRSTGIVPPAALEVAATLKTALLAAALFALGTAVDVRALLTTGQRALGVGLASWLLVAGVALAGVLLVH
jgi:uncharacterized membrane protein YadS